MEFRKILTTVLALTFLSFNAWAGTVYHLYNGTETQVRGQQNGQRAAEVNNFSQFSLTEMPRETRFTGYGQYTREVGPNKNNYNLYNFQVASDKLVDMVGLSIGRQSLVLNRFEGLMDGANLRLTPGDAGVSVDLFGAFTPANEWGDLVGTPGLQTGVKAQWNPTSDTALSLNTSYRRNNFKEAKWNRNSTQLIGFAGSQRLGKTRTIRLYANADYDIAGKILPIGTFGAMWQATPLFNVTVSGSYYGVNKHLTQPTVLSILTHNNGFWQGRVGVQYSVIDEITLFANYDFQRLKPGTAVKYGSIAEGGLNFDLSDINFFGTLLYRFVDSYGGRANDVSLVMKYSPIKQLIFDEFTNYSKYTKITNDNGYAIATGIGLTYEPVRYVELRVGGEFDRNNLFARDWRVDSSLTLRWDNVQ